MGGLFFGCEPTDAVLCAGAALAATGVAILPGGAVFAAHLIACEPAPRFGHTDAVILGG